jgi:hypothetical protein
MSRAWTLTLAPVVLSQMRASPVRTTGEIVRRVSRCSAPLVRRGAGGHFALWFGSVEAARVQ